ncbi:hypothetical protein VQH23_06390 [Pararoseomonas sp. SCSIO 73927]|uniref:hypothetical protein n=1 Tax=Pararoseomonas sp. SCSIO 73927 TaxID=3114537 RepID=UPI0030CF8695
MSTATTFAALDEELGRRAADPARRPGDHRDLATDLVNAASVGHAPFPCLRIRRRRRQPSFG